MAPASRAAALRVLGGLSLPIFLCINPSSIELFLFALGYLSAHRVDQVPYLPSYLPFELSNYLSAHRVDPVAVLRGVRKVGGRLQQRLRLVLVRARARARARAWVRVRVRAAEILPLALALTLTLALALALTLT